MEIDSSLIIKHDKLEAFGIFRKAFTISATNMIGFLFFTIFTSLPLFCFLVYYEPFLQRFHHEISDVLLNQDPPPTFDSRNSLLLYQSRYSYRSRLFRWSMPIDITTNLNNDFPGELIQLGLLYLIPLQLLELSTILVIVDLASKTCAKEEGEPALTFKEMIHKPFDATGLVGTLVTFVYVLVMSTCALLGLIWLAVTYFVVVTMYFSDALVFVWCWVGYLGLLAMYLGWSAVWNMSVVISIVEGKHGKMALALAMCYSVGNEWRGFRLMLLFFAWEVALRLPCIYFGCTGIWNNVGVLAQIGLFCFGNAVKWVVFTVYFYDCKGRELEKKLMMKAKKRTIESS